MSETVQSEHLADIIEAAASRDLYRAAPPAFGLQFSSIGSATALIAPELPLTYFNRVIGLGNGEPASAKDIDDISDTYADHHVRDYWIHIGACAKPTDLATQLERRGFTCATRPTWAKFLRETELMQARDTPFTLREAETADAKHISAVICAAYGLPDELTPWFASLVGRAGWRVWLAELDGDVVATGSLFAHGDTAWLGVAATLAQHRGLGAQSSLLAARICVAAQLGCRVIATETGEPRAGELSPSLNNIRRAGFVQVSSRLNYASPGRYRSGPPHSCA
ncbi:MAG: hypothetical protein QOI59_1719 [Gammaproteobacteria bacterium]|nr:hypothetical protein [Gammaproteobacteria bacterium]